MTLPFGIDISKHQGVNDFVKMRANTAFVFVKATKSICVKLRNKFAVSAAEVESQDVHRTAVIGVAYVASSTAQIDSVLDHLIAWLENSCEADLVDIQRDIC